MYKQEVLAANDLSTAFFCILLDKKKKPSKC